jgi:hypothetical protein
MKTNLIALLNFQIYPISKFDFCFWFLFDFCFLLFDILFTISMLRKSVICIEVEEFLIFI